MKGNLLAFTDSTVTVFRQGPMDTHKIAVIWKKLAFQNHQFLVSIIYRLYMSYLKFPWGVNDGKWVKAHELSETTPPDFPTSLDRFFTNRNALWM